MTINEKIEYHLNLAKLALMQHDKKQYDKQVKEVRRLTKGGE